MMSGTRSQGRRCRCSYHKKILSLMCESDIPHRVLSIVLSIFKLAPENGRSLILFKVAHSLLSFARFFVSFDVRAIFTTRIRMRWWVIA